jgi:hypothetical protein
MRVEAILRWLLDECDFIHRARRRCLLTVLGALFTVGRATITSLGRSLPGAAAPKHKIKRVDRLVGNARLWREAPRILERIAHRLVGTVARPVILLDWTGIGAGLYALVAAIPVAGRAVPVLADIHRQERYGNRKVQRLFLDRLALLLPAKCKPIIVADAGFKAPFYEYVEGLGWGFVVRLRGKNRRFRLRDRSFKQVLKMAKKGPQDLGDRWIGKDFQPRLILGARKPKASNTRPRNRAHPQRVSALEPWVLATNLWRHSPADVVAVYALRMRIEEAFRDAKSHQYGWGVEYLRSRDPARVETLLCVVALATAACALAGLAAEHRGGHRRYQANTTRHRRVLSVVTLGRAVLLDGAVTIKDLRHACRLVQRGLRSVPQHANSSAWQRHAEDCRAISRSLQ